MIGPWILTVLNEIIRSWLRALLEDLFGTISDKLRELEGALKYFKVIRVTLKYFKVLPSTSTYFKELQSTENDPVTRIR